MSRQDPSNAGTNWSIGAALGAALGASACCTVPLALVSLGVGGAWIGSLTALAPYRWFFVAGAVGALGYAGYNEWRLSRQPDCDCETVFSSGPRRTLLSVGALAVVALVVSPWLVAPSPTAATQTARTAAMKATPPAAETSSSTPASYRQVVLRVDGMTCKTCPITVRKALEEVRGVYGAEATLEPPQAVVRFDPGKTSVEALTAATKTVGFPSQLNTDS
ncbi:MAG: mercuric transporter MerT family protein [Salinibacter sp.]|uniref:mercuric transporter MerT family protein n=1 Tax=Salinibacter sp. TaxID=2065818 RepID=UPI0035D45BC7